MINERRKVMRTQLRRRLAHAFLLAVSFTLFLYSAQIVQAQEFPTKPVTMLAPVGPGGTIDLTGRALVSVASDYLGQPIIFQLKPGAGGAIASDFVAKSAPDGYTILFGGGPSNSSYPAIEGRSKGPDDLEAICQINYIAPFILVRSESPFKTLKELIDSAKANPGKLVFGNTGPWGAGDLVWKQVKLRTGITTRDVPHDGGGPSLLAILGGNVDVVALGISQILPHIKAGKLRPLAVTDNNREPNLPDVPTAKEQGIDFVYRAWQGVMAPKGTPRPIINKLAGAFKKMTEDKSFVTMMKQLGPETQYLGPDELTKYWRDEYEGFKELGKAFKK
jgi:tripartite-type tricarboxylate transporter receptor subunit TctC